MSHRIYSDIEKNYLFIEIGVVERKNYQIFKDTIVKESGRLKQGFKCITDLRSFHISSKQNKFFYEMISFVQNELKKNLVGKLVRVVHPQAVLIAQLILTDFKQNNDSSFVATIEEAHEI